jgi:hypothetical protein
MLRQRRKNDSKSGTTQYKPEHFVKSNMSNDVLQDSANGSLRDYLKFTVYCLLLAIPLYAITMSILKHDWVMVIIDALIVPVGFVHGLLLLFAYMS